MASALSTSPTTFTSSPRLANPSPLHSLPSIHLRLSLPIPPIRGLTLSLSSRRPPQKWLLSAVPESLEAEPEAVVEEEMKPSKISIPKGEEVFAVVMVGGRQYIVFPGRFIYTQRLKGADESDKIILNKVLLVGTKKETYIGKPVVENAAVHAVVEEQGLNKKVIVYKYKKRKNYRRNIGHRQPNTRIRITGITGYQDYLASTLPA
ncbi:hypothetical protein QJS10_CPA08g01112 [Acorus calamus]|uniref:50S ribosomal protein L21, chloroplastic n=1 Tax=Acorus calamus TaxID=4465 RepID=A0AAV9ED09_ACOCL|nr:hypothetical protein QJS10_CPA08g01112 [Acorus calamus]